MPKHASANTAVPHLPLIPPVLIGWLAVFQPYFTAPTWQHVLVLVAGAVLAPGKRTVSQVLWVMGLAEDVGFARYHEVLKPHAGMHAPWHSGSCCICSTGCCPAGRW